MVDPSPLFSTGKITAGVSSAVLPSTKQTGEPPKKIIKELEHLSYEK